jgi:hypothetical protein
MNFLLFINIFLFLHISELNINGFIIIPYGTDIQNIFTIFHALASIRQVLSENILFISLMESWYLHLRQRADPELEHLILTFCSKASYVTKEVTAGPKEKMLAIAKDILAVRQQLFFI